MKKYLYKFMFLSLCLFSCEDTLDQRLSSSIIVEESIVDLASLGLATNGAYSLFIDADSYGRSIVLIPEIVSDNAFIDAFDNTGRYLDYDILDLNSNDGNAEGLYNHLSDVVASTSISIREASEIVFLDSEIKEANGYLGELYALRALAYHNFLLFYSQPFNFTVDASHLGAPIPNYATLGDGSILQEPARATVMETYDIIINDLTQALSLMEVNSISSPSPIRFNHYAAKALLARIYLHMERWASARDTATEVINDSGLQLVDNSNYLTNWSNGQGTDEGLFSIVFNSTDDGNLGSNSIRHFYLEYKDAFATQDFINTFSNDDVRKSLYNQEGSLFLVNKYSSSDSDVNTDNIPVLRLSEMYLIKAEAHARLMEFSMAQSSLDAIIQRADFGAPNSTEIDQNLIDKIILERRKELGFEGFRLFDLTRTQTDYTKFRQEGGDIFVENPNNNTILPIPNDELNTNPNMIQNAGY